MYVRPGIDFRAYTGLLVEEPELAFRTPDRSKRQFPLTNAQKSRFRELLAQKFRIELAKSKRLRIVEEAGRAEQGGRPGAMVAVATRQTVEILSVASDGKAVSFRDADGLLQSIDVRREEGQAFARKLKSGDLVDIQYTEAIAIAVESTGSGN